MLETIGGITAGAAGLGALGLSLRYTWWRRRLPGVPVLMYHHITNQLNGTILPKLRITTEAFARQLDLILDLGYRTITLGQALSPHAPKNAVVLTFDDGYRNFYTQAWPLLRHRGMVATVFLVTGNLDGVNRWDQGKGEPMEPLMNRHEITELARHGIELGGHSHSHQNLTELGDRELIREITGCQKMLSDILGRSSKVFSYPYGLWNHKVAQAVERAGFDAACVTQPGKLDRATPAYCVPRIIVKRADNLIDLKLKLARAKSRL